MENQLECIHRTQYQDRILHVDATGSLVSINNKQDKFKCTNYKRILNYFFYLKVIQISTKIQGLVDSERGKVRSKWALRVAVQSGSTKEI